MTILFGIFVDIQPKTSYAIVGENRQLVADEPAEFEK